ncbi:MAG: CocE/NonD family hydrolase, partial [Thermomicrobiales bacterium]|nr:CocE/NonD family hydrolase [Thermomicrobiales bacterium]
MTSEATAVPGVGVTVEYNVPATMRDGTTLYADVYRPEGDGPWPVILMRLPYDKTSAENISYADPSWYARQGYLVVVQDVRGTAASDGEFVPFQHEAEDGYDTIEWAAAQPWSNGRVGMFGGSYQGITQWAAAIARPPHLVCITPLTSTWTSFGDDLLYAAPGVMALSGALSWAWGAVLDEANRRGVAAPAGALHHGEESSADTPAGDVAEAVARRAEQQRAMYDHRPLRDLPELGLLSWWKDWCDHSDPTDPYWTVSSAVDHLVDLDLPVLHVSGWYDLFLRGTVDAFQQLRRYGSTAETRGAQELVVGPWHHGGMCPPRPDAPADHGAPLGLWDLSPGSPTMTFLDRHLKGIDSGPVAPVRVFVMGANRWRHEAEWPLPSTEWTPWYLRSDGHANTAGGDGWLSIEPPGEEPADVYVDDPADPVPSAQRLEAYAPDHGAETAAAADRADVLVYDSRPLDADIEVVGPIHVELWAASSVVDTNLVVKLVDVFP